MKLRTINYSIGQGIIGAWRNRYMVLASTGVAIATLLMFGIFVLAVFNLRYLQDLLKENYTIQAHFDLSTTDERIEQIISELQSRQDIKEVRFISKEEGAKTWSEKDESIAEILNELVINGENPLSDSIMITTSKADVITVEDTISTYSEITKHRNTSEQMNDILRWTGYIGIVIFIIMIIFVAISIFTISNTIKLGLYARRKEINIMKYIGATDKFIKLPFIIETILIGLMAILVSFPIISRVYIFAEQYINNGLITLNSHNIFQARPYKDLIWQLCYCYIGAGIFISVLGSSISIKKHLEV